MRTILLFVFSFVTILTIKNVYAQEACNSTKECKSLLFQVESRLNKLRGAVDLTALIKKGDLGTGDYCHDTPDQSVCPMSQVEADAYCSEFHGGLPTLKQLVLAVNPRDVNEKKDAASFKISENGENNLYYKRKLAQAPHPAGADAWLDFIWTSKLSSFDSSFAHIVGFGYASNQIGGYHRDRPASVRCVAISRDL